MSKLLYDTQELDVLAAMERYEHRIVLVDAKTNGFCLPVLKQLLPSLRYAEVIIVPDGEANKNWQILQLIWEELTRLGAGRNTLLISLGGGVLSDLGGFAASTFKRGIPSMYIPTTLTAMVDAALGGKTGIDWMGYKNLIGSFYPASLIYIQPTFLHTLPKDHIYSGMVEMWKHALIDSAQAWQDIQDCTPQDLIHPHKIKTSIAIKQGLVELDPFDRKERQALNLGHSIGHAIEAYRLHQQPLLHGEAVLLGLIFECELAENILGLKPTIRQELKALKARYFPNLMLNCTPEDLVPWLLQDKKNDDGIRMSLLQAPGHIALQQLVTIEDLIKLSWYD